MLRESSKAKGEAYDLALMTGAGGDGNIPNGSLLIAFTDAVMGNDDAALSERRDEVRATIGDAALVDAAAVASAFNGFTRIADSTGIPIEEAKAQSTAEFRSALGINAFAENRGETPEPNG